VDDVFHLVPAPADYAIRGVILTSQRLYSPPTSIRFVTPCSDGADNDGDGRIDYPADTGCHAPGDVSEEITDDDLALEVVPRIKGYVTGEWAFFDLRITNLAGETYRRTFGSSCFGFFTVDNPGAPGVLYDLRKHVGCPAVRIRIFLVPAAVMYRPGKGPGTWNFSGPGMNIY